MRKQLTGDEFCEWYEGKLKTTKVLAFTASVMHGLSWFLGFCALTWASAVILGGLLTYLTQHDYYSVVALLLLEAVRLSTTTFFGKFCTWMLVHGSTDPQRLVYHDSTRQNIQGIAHIAEQAVRVTVVGMSILLPIRRIQDLHVLSAPVQDLNVLAPSQHPTQVGDFDGLKTSLWIFYILVLVNGVINGFAMIITDILVPYLVDSFSLRKYYEKIVWKAMDEGLLRATDFGFLSWTFQMQADEYRRNVRALVVKELYGDMIKFLYYHPRHKGFEAVKVAFESENTFEREAAANIVGLWVTVVTEDIAADESHHEESAGLAADILGFWTTPVAESHNGSAALLGMGRNRKNKYEDMLGRLLMQKKLLTKLAEALDNDESGRAASLSFYELAKKVPEGVLRVRVGEKDEKVADMLMDCIRRTMEARKPKNAFVYIKAVRPLLEHLIASHGLGGRMMPEDENEIGQYCTMAKLKILKEDMRAMVYRHARGLKRLEAVAAHAYILLLSADELRGLREEQCRSELLGAMKRKPEGQRRTHILQDEQESLFLVLGERQLPNEWGGLVQLREINPKRPPCLARFTTALIASCVSIVVLFVSSIFISRYAHF